MASIRKRGKKWRVEIRTKSFYQTRSFIHKETALKWARDIEVTLEREEQPGGLKLVSDAIQKYLKEITPKKKGARWERVRFNKFLTYPICNKRLSSVKPTDFSEWRDARLKEVSSASVRRELVLWSALFSACVSEWQWISESPLRKVKKPSSGKHRERVISEAEQAKIIEALGKYGAGAEVARLFQLALETGMRLGEMVGLSKGDIFEDYLIIRDTKNSDSRHVPLTKKAKEHVRIATVTVDYASRKFREASRKAKVKDVTFHDSRHTAATRLAHKLNILDLCRMFGWRDPRHAMTYYNPHASDIAKRLETA